MAARRLGKRPDATRTSAEVDLIEAADRSYGLAVRLTVHAEGLGQGELEEVVALADRLCLYSHAVRGNVEVELRAQAVVADD